MSSVPWPHAPVHQLSDSGTYIVTAGTYLKAHHFRGANRLAVLERGLLKLTTDFGWRLQAWAVFSNHYHFVAHSPADGGAESMRDLITVLHRKTSTWINRLESKPGRKVWHNFWESRLTFEKSYLARLKYVHETAVHHRLVPVANQYPWCSSAWFERVASSAQIKSLRAFKTDALNVMDPYEPLREW